MKIQLKRATIEDVELIWKMQIEAFVELLAKYQDMGTNSGNETIEKVIISFIYCSLEDSLFLKIQILLRVARFSYIR